MARKKNQPKVKEEPVVIKNWRGLDSHPTDQYLFWSSDVKRMEEIRGLYDKVLNQTGQAQIDAMEDFMLELATEAKDEAYFYAEGDNI